MKTEEEIIDEVYENKIYGIVNVYSSALITQEPEGELSHELRFKTAIKIMAAVRDRAKELLKEVSK